MSKKAIKCKSPSAVQDAAFSKLRKRRGKNNPIASTASTGSDDSVLPDFNPQADYYLIREPEVLDEIKNARVDALPFFDRVKYLFSGDCLLERGKYENAPFRLIEKSLGPEIYRVSLSYKYDALPWSSNFILRSFEPSFQKTLDKVNNDYATAKYDSHGNQAFVRMWCNSKCNRLEIRLHDSARKPDSPAGKTPMTQGDLHASETNLAVTDKLLYHCTPEPHNPNDSDSYLSNFIVRERLVE